MQQWKWALGGVVLGLLGGCASLPTQYFSLASPGQIAAAESDALPWSADYGMRLKVVSIPAEVNRLQLLVRDPAADPSVEILNQSLWAAPLGDQLQSALAAQVSTLLGAPDLQQMTVSPSMPVRDIKLRITRFELIWGQGTRLDAVWVDQPPGQKPARLCQAHISTVGTQPEVASLVEHQRQALHQLAASIAGAGVPVGSPVSGLMLKGGCT